MIRRQSATYTSSLTPPPRDPLCLSGSGLHTSPVCLSCLSHHCPCLVLISHLSLPWAQIPSGLAAPTLASSSLSLDPQNIALYEWLPSFLQKTPPEYTGESFGGTPWLRVCVCSGSIGVHVMGRCRGKELISVITLVEQGTALSWTPVSLQSSWRLLNSFSPLWCPLAST